MTRIQSGTAEFHLNGLDPDEFPRLPQVDGGQQFRLPADLLRSMICQTVLPLLYRKHVLY